MTDFGAFHYVIMERGKRWDVRTDPENDQRLCFPGVSFRISQLESWSHLKRVFIGYGTTISSKSLRRVLNAYYEWFGWPAFEDCAGDEA